MTATGERGRVLVLCDFTGKRLTHAGLAHLRNLPRLSSVALYGPGFGEYSLPHLSTLPALQLLTLAE